MPQPFEATKIQDIHWDDGRDVLGDISEWGIKPARRIITLIDRDLADLDLSGDNLEAVDNIIVTLNTLGQILEDVSSTMERLNDEYSDYKREQKQEAEKDPASVQEEVVKKLEIVETFLKISNKVFEEIKALPIALGNEKAVTPNPLTRTA